MYTKGILFIETIELHKITRTVPLFIRHLFKLYKICMKSYKTLNSWV